MPDETDHPVPERIVPWLRLLKLLLTVLLLALAVVRGVQAPLPF